MTDDPYLDPLRDFKTVVEQDTSEDQTPPMPPAIQNLLEMIRSGVGDGVQVRSVRLQVDETGKLIEEAEEEESNDIPAEVLNRIAAQERSNDLMVQFISRLHDLAHGGQAPKDCKEEHTPDNFLQLMGVTGDLANEVLGSISDMVEAVGKDQFDERAFAELFTGTDLFEQMTYHAGMYFCMGVFVGQERSLQASGTDDNINDSEPEQRGDSGRDREE